VVKLICSVCK